MKLRDYLEELTPEDRERFAERCGVTLFYLRFQVAAGHCLPSQPLALKIERESGGRVCRHESRPQDNPPEECPEMCPGKRRAAIEAA